MSKPLTTTDIADFDVIFNSDDSGTPAGKGVGGGRNPYRPFPSDPDYIGYRNQGHTATDKDWVPPKDIFISQRILFEAISPDKGVVGMNNDKMGWFCPVVIINGISTFSMEEIRAPPCVIDKCTAASELQTLGAEKQSRQYTMEMYGIGISLAPELIQRATENQLKNAYKVKVIQTINSIAMTLQQTVYSNVYRSPTLEYIEFRNMRNEREVSRRALFYGTYQKRIDNFLLWNLRRTHKKAVLVDLDNSLNYTSNSSGDADTIICHPVAAGAITDFAVENGERDDESREVYYVNTSDGRIVYEESIQPSTLLSYKESAPRLRSVVNAKTKYVIPCPDVRVNDQKYNLSELEANFKTFNVIGYCPLPHQRGTLLDFKDIASVDWNSIYVSDFEKRSDTRITLEEVMEQCGYFLTETYNPVSYNNLLRSVDFIELSRVTPTEYYRTCILPFNGREKLSLLDPSRKVFYDPERQTFLPAITYGHSNVSTCPVDRGDIVSGMTFMARTMVQGEDGDDEQLLSNYMRDCLSLEWRNEHFELLEMFDGVSFRDAMSETLEGGRLGHLFRGVLRDVKSNKGATHFTNYDQLLIVRHFCQVAKDNNRDEGEVGREHNNDELDPLECAVANITMIVELVDTLYEKYKAVTRTKPDTTHSWLFTPLGHSTLQKTFRDIANSELDSADEDDECVQENLALLLNKASIYHNIVLRSFSPS